MNLHKVIAIDPNVSTNSMWKCITYVYFYNLHSYKFVCLKA